MNSLRLSLTRRSLARFSRAMMPAFEVAPCHQLIIEHLERLLAGKIKKLAITTPPRHGKSTLGNVMMPAFALGRNPRESIITVSYGSDLAEGFGRRVRNILADPAFREVFPVCELSPDSQAVYRFMTVLGGEYNAVGRGGPVTGRGASLLILDDLIKDSAEANSEVICRSIIDWLQGVAFTRLTPDGRVLAIATRWSERDPMGWILQQQGWTVLHLPAFAKADDPLGREAGEALWPSHYPAEALEAIRADVGSRVFACLYQGDVAAAQGNIFKRDWYRHYQQPPEKFNRIIQSWDTAFQVGKSNDYSVCATIGETQNGFYLLALYRAKVEFPELKRQVALQADFWKPQEILVEDKASGQSLIQELKLATTYPVIAVKVDRDKETRASAVTAFFEAGRVLFPEGAAWLGDLEDELASFPGGLHDDCVDAISQALNRLRDSGGGILGLIDYYKRQSAVAVNTLRQRTLAFEEGLLRRRGIVKGQLGNQPAAAPTATLPSCSHCGASGLEPRGNKLFCARCWRFQDLPALVDVQVQHDPTQCPLCGLPGNLIPGGMRRCPQEGFQWWPSGVAPEIPVARRTIIVPTGGRYGRFS